MKIKLFCSASLFLVMLAACQKEKGGGNLLFETCKPEMIVLDSFINGAPAERDTSFLYFNDNNDGFYDVGEGIQQSFSDKDNHTDYKWGLSWVTIERWSMGVLLARTSHALDEYRRSVEEIRSEAFAPTTTTLRTYDQEGHVLQTKTYSNIADQTLGTHQWENGNLKRVIYESPTGSSVLVYEYYPDLNNTLSTEILPVFGKASTLLVKRIVSSSGDISSYSYELDTKGK
ncbi:MAG: hypothetical protein H7246_14710, partial [Phycisphaerae bacterium]|nr:hypothetical protein [Saprospiraceae bacterium]